MHEARDILLVASTFFFPAKSGRVNLLKEQVELMMQTTAYEKGSRYRQEGHRKQFETWNPILWLLNLYYL